MWFGFLHMFLVASQLSLRLAASLQVTYADVDPAIKDDFQLVIDQEFVNKSNPTGLNPALSELIYLPTNKAVCQDILAKRFVLGNLAECTNFTQVLDLHQSVGSDGSQFLTLYLQGVNGYIQRSRLSWNVRGTFEQILGTHQKGLLEYPPFSCQSEHVRVISQSNSESVELRACQIRDDAPGVSRGIQIYAAVEPKSATSLEVWLLAKLPSYPVYPNSTLNSRSVITPTSDRLAVLFHAYTDKAPAPTDSQAQLSIFSVGKPFSESLISIPGISAVRILEVLELDSENGSGPGMYIFVAGVPTIDKGNKEIVQLCALQQNEAIWSSSVCVSILIAADISVNAIQLPYRKGDNTPALELLSRGSTGALEVYSLFISLPWRSDSVRLVAPAAHWTQGLGLGTVQIIPGSPAEGRGLKFEMQGLGIWEGPYWRKAATPKSSTLGVWARSFGRDWIEVTGGGCTVTIGGDGVSKVSAILGDLTEQETTTSVAKRTINWYWPAKQQNFTADITINFRSYDLKLTSNNFTQSVIANEFSKLIWKENQIKGGPYNLECINSTDICKLARNFNKVTYHDLAGKSKDAPPQIKFDHNLWFGTDSVLVDLKSNKVWNCLKIGFNFIGCNNPTLFSDKLGGSINLQQILDLKVTIENIYCVIEVKTDQATKSTRYVIAYHQPARKSVMSQLDSDITQSQTDSTTDQYQIIESPTWQEGLIFWLSIPNTQPQASNLSTLVFSYSNPSGLSIRKHLLLSSHPILSFSVSLPRSYLAASQAFLIASSYLLTLSTPNTNLLLSFNTGNPTKAAYWEEIINRPPNTNVSDFAVSELGGGALFDYKSKFFKDVNVERLKYTSLVRDFGNEIYRVRPVADGSRILLLPAYSVTKLGVIHPKYEHSQSGYFSDTQESLFDFQEGGKFYEYNGKIFHKRFSKSGDSTSDSGTLSWMTLDPSQVYFNQSQPFNDSNSTKIYAQHSLTCRTPVELQEIKFSVLSAPTPKSKPQNASCQNTAKLPGVCDSFEYKPSAGSAHLWRVGAEGPAGTKLAVQNRFNRIGNYFPTGKPCWGSWVEAEWSLCFGGGKIVVTLQQARFSWATPNKR